MNLSFSAVLSLEFQTKFFFFTRLRQNSTSSHLTPPSNSARSPACQLRQRARRDQPAAEGLRHPNDRVGVGRSRLRLAKARHRRCLPQLHREVAQPAGQDQGQQGGAVNLRLVSLMVKDHFEAIGCASYSQRAWDLIIQCHLRQHNWWYGLFFFIKFLLWVWWQLGHPEKFRMAAILEKEFLTAEVKLAGVKPRPFSQLTNT